MGSNNDIIPDTQKNIVIVGPSSSGKSTLINEWVNKGHYKNKDICMGKDYIKNGKEKKLIHYNILRGFEKHRSNDPLADNILKEILKRENLLFYILLIKKENLLKRINNRTHLEYKKFGSGAIKLNGYHSNTVKNIVNKCDYGGIYKSFIKILEDNNIEYILCDNNEKNIKIKDKNYDYI
tara:strand:- start:1222 stop:1761 length:540 start_codon:yes stop_codon:yes gene_type:complete